MNYATSWYVELQMGSWTTPDTLPARVTLAVRDCPTLTKVTIPMEHFIEKVRSVAPVAFDVDAQQVWELVIELDFIDYQLSRLNGNWRSFVLVTPVKINPDGTVAHYPDAFEYVCPRQPVIYVDEQD